MKCKQLKKERKRNIQGIYKKILAFKNFNEQHEDKEMCA